VHGAHGGKEFQRPLERYYGHYEGSIKEGQIPQTVTGWACLYCNVEVWNRDASRLALHLSGDAGLRDASNGFSGIRICPRVPSDVADRAKIDMAAKTAKKARKSSLSAAGNVMASEEGDLRAEKRGSL